MHFVYIVVCLYTSEKSGVAVKRFLEKKKVSPFLGEATRNLKTRSDVAKVRDPDTQVWRFRSERSRRSVLSEPLRPFLPFTDPVSVISATKQSQGDPFQIRVLAH